MDEQPQAEISASLAALINETNRLEDDWRWEEALAAWDRARGVAGDDERLLAECESGRARALFALGRIEEADNADEAAMHHFRAAGERALAKLCEASLAWRAGMMGQIEDALIVAGEARDEIDAMRDDDNADMAGARVRQMLARVYFAAGQPDEGERQYLEARDRFADAGDDRRLARCDAALALDLLGAGRLEDAEGRAEAAVAGMTMLERSVDAAQLQLVLGRIQADGERHQEALANFAAAAATFRDRELWLPAAEALHLEALMLTITGEDAEALDRFAEAIDIAIRAGSDGGEGVSLLERALVYGRLGRFDEATAEFERASAALARAGDEVGTARATYGVGTTRRDAGDLEGALVAFTAAAESFAQMEAPGAEAQARFDGASVLGQMGRVDEALAWLDRAAEGFAIDGEPLHVALVRRAWGTLAGLDSRPVGLDALAEARAVFAEHGAVWDAAECDDMSARVLGLLDRGEEALGAAEAAVSGFRAAEDGVAVAATEILVGQLLVENDRAEEAVAHLETAISEAMEQGAEGLGAQSHQVLTEVLESLGRDAEASIHRAAALRLMSSAGDLEPPEG